MDFKVVELFAGVGGFRVGLNNIKKFDEKTGRAIENGNWNFVWANQWEPSTKIQPAYDCYVTRFGVRGHSNVDINKIKKNEIPNHSLLVGGFPCQDYSVARSLSNEKGIEGKKGVLWWDILDVINEKRPPFILLENVDRLLKSPAKQRGRDFAIMLKSLNEKGYIVEWRVVNAGEYGMPQRRRRVFIFASLNSTNYVKKINELEINEYLIKDGFFNDIFPVELESIKIEEKQIETYSNLIDISDNYNGGKFLTSGIMINNKIVNFDIKEKYIGQIYSLNDILCESSKYKDINLKDYVINELDINKWKYLKGGKKIQRYKPNGEEYFYSEGSMNFPENLELPGRTMLTSEGTINRSSHAIYDLNIKKIRKITEIEAELLQMFPVNWTNTGMTSRQRYFMMGNALVTGIISKLEPKLRQIIESEEI